MQSLDKEFSSVEKAQKLVKFKKFSKFADTTEALASAAALVDSKLSKSLKKFLKKVQPLDATAIMYLLARH